MEKQHYTVTVVIAAPSTPLYDDGQQKKKMVHLSRPVPATCFS